MSNGMSNFGSKQKIYGSQPKIDTFAEELKQAVSYQSLNTVNEGTRSSNSMLSNRNPLSISK